ncbi:hypothetical protein BaRGS_00019005 [Batillaria attramentaria]|uniref:Uncharacterized protein n=1 Tax=Batillaria attramentaria TaxID=370345 RepID=A0ABD0KS79_9CAEN
MYPISGRSTGACVETKRRGLFWVFAHMVRVLWVNLVVRKWRPFSKRGCFELRLVYGVGGGVWRVGDSGTGKVSEFVCFASEKQTFLPFAACRPDGS